MAKPFGGMGGGAAMPKPMPNPRLNPLPASPAPSRPGLFANMPIQKRFDMAMDLLKNGMQMGAESGSPLMAFLSPLAGAAIGGGIENKRAKLMGEQNDELMASMMPGANSEEVQRLADIVNNPDTPDYLKSVAKAKLDAAIAPYTAAPGGGGGGSGGGSGKGKGSKKPTSTDVLLSSMFSDAIDPDGDGGEEITAAEQGRIDALKAARSKGAGASSAATAPIILNGYTIEEVD